MVEKDGSPKVAYHGSIERGITEFNPEIEPVRTRTGPNDVYFTDSVENAADYTRAPRAGIKTPCGSVTAAYIRLQDPLNITADVKRLQKRGMPFSGAKQVALQKLDRKVNDGVVFDGNGANPPEHIAFDSASIKSATCNNGNFDINQRDINKSTVQPQTETPEFNAGTVAIMVNPLNKMTLEQLLESLPIPPLDPNEVDPLMRKVAQSFSTMAPETMLSPSTSTTPIEKAEDG
ncbi:hypothetical protein HC248_01937 [Polaromonas vacuolata]|uniref:ART-PolyVal-like domain-containing protein n=1 Tax=Polaromonas vacuolata TaxID=37448 RepID=A0A6H2H9T2_9BURK|nr:hypothetical protein [Polaromonas vacuolata]QJC56629.1 hypothetical protein HC248_01937 [Polaromonas vacuolata]